MLTKYTEYDTILYRFSSLTKYIYSNQNSVEGTIQLFLPLKWGGFSLRIEYIK